MHEGVFKRLVESVCRSRGVPDLRRVYIPKIQDGSPETIRGLIEGNDPTTGQPFMQGLVDALTRPLPVRRDQIDSDRSLPRVLDPDTPENLHRLFEENRWTDFLPIVLPTEERVAAMLRGTSRDPGEVVGHMAPTFFGRAPWEYTVEKVAVNAVMAGARPEYLPVILALAATERTARQSSITSAGTMTVVNGPIRDEIGMNYGIGALGPYNHANATIGRAYGLLSQNLQGGSVPGESHVGSIGNNLMYNNVCFAENEQDSPWSPMHTKYGFGPEDSTVSVLTPVWSQVYGHGIHTHWEDKFRLMLGALDPTHGVVMVLDPQAARELVALGMSTRERMEEWLLRNARLRVRDYWEHHWVTTFHKSPAVRGVEPFASRLGRDPDDLIEVYSPDRVTVVVTGGETHAAVAFYDSYLGADISGTDEESPDGPQWRAVSVDAWR